MRTTRALAPRAREVVFPGAVIGGLLLVVFAGASEDPLLLPLLLGVGAALLLADHARRRRPVELVACGGILFAECGARRLEGRVMRGLWDHAYTLRSAALVALGTLVSSGTLSDPARPEIQLIAGLGLVLLGVQGLVKRIGFVWVRIEQPSSRSIDCLVTRADFARLTG